MRHPTGVDLNLAAERAYPTLLSNSTLLPLLLLSLAKQKNSPNTSPKINKQYDYIVVGAGTAGSVVASRLSEMQCVSVLLLEAGPPPPRLNDVLAIGRNFWFTNLDWQFKTTPQKHTGRGLINRQAIWPSGRGLGGTTLLNGGVHVRGNRKDYDDWAAMGAKGWSYKEVLPYFKKLEDNRDPEYVANGYHGIGGPITVMRPSYEAEIKGPIFHAAKEMGYRIVDPNARRQTGFYDFQANLRHNQRCSTAKAYLVPAENRTNLDILPNAFVKKIIINEGRARGVIVDIGHSEYRIKANREVIVSAGAIKTPHLLMLSGIGPKDELRKFNIPVHADLPVGRNLQDHGGTGVEYLLSPYIQEISQKITDERNIKRFIHNRTGVLASVEGVSNIAFLLDDKINPKVDYPNYQIYFVEGSTTAPQQQYNLKPEVYQHVYGPYENQSLLFCFSQILHPRSRGQVTLQSSNPYVPPLMDPNYLAHPKDVEDIVEGMKTCSRFANSRQLKRVGVRPMQTLYPGCERYAHDEDAYFRCQARTVFVTVSHYCGTVRMGDPRDSTTVVDPKLRVKNIQGLRVVDTSIMPKIISGNTGVPAIMIGEKASDMIKESIKCSHYDDGQDDYKYGYPEHKPSTSEGYKNDNDYHEASDISHHPYDSLENESGYQNSALENDREEYHEGSDHEQPSIINYYGPSSHKRNPVGAGYRNGVDLNLAAERAYPTLLSNSTLLPLLLLSLAKQKNSPNTSPKINKEYDYIVVGAGTAGSVVASRLSEVPCISVLLLEAGPPPPRLNDVLAIGRNFWFTDLDWQFKTTPQKHTGRGLINRQATWPSGRGLGGSTLLNGGVHVRGNRKDYDDWAAMGAKGWSYKEVLPYFKKLEDNRDPEYIANGYHGVGGPITVMRPSYEAEIKGPIFHAAKEMGYRIIDPNARRQTGFYDLQANLRHNQRCSTAKAYLVPAENRTNLDILPNAFVKKIIINKGRAREVIVDIGHSEYRIRANREVIVSAGAIKTPQLLMLSGIGPKEELRKFNIPVHADLPVGRNLQDHGGTTVDYLLSPYIQEITQKITDERNIKRFIHNRTGVLATVEGLSNIAFLLHDKINPKVDYPNYQIYFSEGSTTIPQQQFNLKPEVYQQVYGPYENQPLMICFSQILHPRSRGQVTLQSSNPYVPPLIDPNYLAHPQDIEDIVEGMKTCSRFANSRQLKRVGVRPMQTLYPGCERYAHDEDAYFRCQARTVLITLSHYCGTARMGDPRDPTTVVDPKLRVKNIQGLRVVDTSIIPKIISGNTGVPAIMIGEKASDLIKESIKCSHYDDGQDDYKYGYPEHKPSTSEGYENYNDYHEASDISHDPYDSLENESGYQNSALENYREEYHEGSDHEQPSLINYYGPGNHKRNPVGKGYRNGKYTLSKSSSKPYILLSVEG